MRPPDLTGLPDLAQHVDALAAQVSGAVIHAHHLGTTPPATVLGCERNLWRWSFQLRHTPTNPYARRAVPDATPDVPRLVAAVVLVDLAAKKDLDLIARDLIATSGTTGDGWRVIHTTVHPDPTRLLAGLTTPTDGTDGTDDPAATVAKLRRRSR